MIKAKNTTKDYQFDIEDNFNIEWRLKLDNNENVYGLSPVTYNALKNVNPQEVISYPNENKLLNKLSNLYSIDKNNIMLTNGTFEVFNIVINTYLDENDTILVSEPIDNELKLFNSNIKLVKYDEAYVFNREKFISNITDDVKMIYFSSPNKITGELVRPNTLELIIEKYPQKLFLIDVAYINFASNVVLLDFIDLTMKYDNVIIMKSFSIDYAMAGLRLCTVFSNCENIKQMKKLKIPNTVNSIALNCANSALNDETYMEKIALYNKQARELFTNSLISLGYKPYSSEANFILCDFGDYCEFCYKKLKNNGILVKKFSNNSDLSTCLKITVPKESAVRYIIEILKKRDILILDTDGVVFDTSNSYIEAIKNTYKYFTNTEVSTDEIFEIKNRLEENCVWNVIDGLLKNNGKEIEISEIIRVYQNIFYNPNDLDRINEYLINKEELLISKEVLENISKEFDLVLFSQKLREEVMYLLKKYKIDKFFHYCLTSDDLPKNLLKPNPKGILEIIKHSVHNDIKYFGSSADDIICGNAAQIETIGVINKSEDCNAVLNDFKHLGAKYILDDVAFIDKFIEDIKKRQ